MFGLMIRLIIYPPAERKNICNDWFDLCNELTIEYLNKKNLSMFFYAAKNAYRYAA
jgi:hypothetical protein